MNVLIIGSGGREHALAWKAAQSPRVERLWIAPGNAGTESLGLAGGNVSLSAEDVAGLLDFAHSNRVDLTIVGPEIPLGLGVVDAFRAQRLAAFGPTQAAAQLETSKAFAKAFMAHHGIPTPAYAVFEDFDAALAHARAARYPVVLKASGLAAGKGVLLPADADEAEAGLRHLLLDGALGGAGQTVVIEERMRGPELSVLAFCDGRHAALMPAAQDHKRAFDGDAGPNTGGMGAVAPVPWADAALLEEARRRIVQPALDGMRAAGMPYIGVLYAGLMLTDAGLQVLEFNCRFGDPEAQVILPLLESDLIEVCQACVAGRLAETPLLWRAGAITLGQVVAFLGLFGTLRFPTWISIFSFNLVQTGVAGARRILELINTETELDDNPTGIAKPIEGEVRFEDVSFGYHEAATLKGVNFTARPGETIAIVGRTGSGKTSLTRLINRIFDVSAGRVLVDGIDVREWNLESLRSQISTIEQDVFLFSRTIAENIAFGCATATQAEIERAAGEAQAHEFITSFSAGYQTEVGERGVTLSGGQRQRIAIARAFLTNPRILILDDSTSAIDSATEDQIQRAMRRISRERTTFLITHRISQIRWADRILVLDRGELLDQGTHEELLARCAAYRRIFARYE